MTCRSIIIGGLTDGPLCKTLGHGPPGLMYTVCRNGAQTRQTSERQLSPG